MPKKVIPDEAQTYIVTRLACFASPSVVAREVKDEWKVVVSLPALAHYNPTLFQGRDLSEELKALFHETRDKYVTGIQDVGIANQRHRLDRLQRLADKAEEDEASRLELDIIKQAREETASIARASSGADSQGKDSRKNDGATPTPGFKARVEELSQLSQEELAERFQEELEL